MTLVGIVNLTPDSFSDGGLLLDAQGGHDEVRLLAHARELLAGGAHVLDVGGESTRPGAPEIDADCEIARTEGAIALLRRHFDVPISIDTRKAAVARRALAAGATIVNDVSGLAHDPELGAVVAEAGAVLILGHLRGVPATMQQSPRYDDVLCEVADELELCVARARAAGVPAQRLAVDPGLGFAKRLEDNLVLLAHLGWLRDRLGLPLLVGPSRKSFLGQLTGDPVGERDAATAAACAVAAFTG
ncbi:MAG TPA: dihydropteroate synthase, partial [Planctomycetota bacterium]|nr:dihydropteroate synthase [Planctomycetota bacterium]